MDEQFDLGADDGTFFMHYNDWRDNFSSLFVNIDFPAHWTGVRFKSAWTRSACGGLPTSMDREILNRFAQNPQFLIKPRVETELMFSMTQTGGRLPKAKRTYSEYPFAETMHYACASVFHLEYGKRHLDHFDRNKLTLLTPVKRERENSGRCHLKGGETYVIVPCTELPNKEGEFYVSIYVDQPLRDVEIKRVFHPNDSNPNKEKVLPLFIPEESEKISARAPTWKIQLCKESLPYMMTDEDTGAVQSSD